ncbi:MAG: hypothetical protein ACRDVK_08005, partial [Acidimicrobiia bacterium]
MDGINIPADVAETAGVPADLDSSAVGPYRFPSPRRRRTATWIFLVLAPLVFILTPSRAVALAMAGVMLVIAGWHWWAAWPLNLQPEEALVIASRRAPFPIGHASAAVIFSGLRSRPHWHVVMYDASEPPRARALVIVDGVGGDVIGDPYTETFVDERSLSEAEPVPPFPPSAVLPPSGGET